MKKIKQPWNDTLDAPILDNWIICDYKTDPDSVLILVDKELNKYGLEIVVADDHGGTFTQFTISKRG